MSQGEDLLLFLAAPGTPKRQISLAKRSLSWGRRSQYADRSSHMVELTEKPSAVCKQLWHSLNLNLSLADEEKQLMLEHTLS